MITLTQIAMELDEARWTPERRRVALAAITARDEALISGAPPWDAARLAAEVIEAMTERAVRAALNL